MARLNHPMEMCALRLWAPLLIWQCVGTAAAANNEELARDRPDGVESGTLLMRTNGAALAFGPGHLFASAQPGRNGNAVFSGGPLRYGVVAEQIKPVRTRI